MADTSSHKKLLERIGDGHLSAVREIAEGRFGYVEILLLKAEKLIGPVLRKRYGPEDAVESLFRVLCQDANKGKKRNFKHSGALRRFLLCVLVNRIKTRGAEDSTDSAPSQMSLADSSADRVMSALEAKDLVDTILQQLNPKERKICLLYTDLLSEKQVSEKLGCSRRTVHRVLERFANLAKRLSDQSDMSGIYRQEK
jgi:RNA polymerase sigma factor (sigma-70 family)